jgi:hypothetical protein
MPSKSTNSSPDPASAFVEKVKTIWARLSPLQRKALALFVLLAPVAYHYYQKPKESGLFEAPFGGQAKGPGNGAYEIYLVDTEQNPGAPPVPAADRLPLSSAQLTKPFGIVIRFHQLVPLQAYQAGCLVKDAQGTKIQGADKILSFQSSNTENWAYWSFYPKPGKNVAGEGKAIITVSGMGEIEHKFNIAGLSDAEKSSLAENDEARRQAIHAFSSFWVVMPHQNLKTYVTAASSVNTPALDSAIAFDKAFADAAGGPVKMPPPVSNDPLKRYSLYQVAGLGFECRQKKLSDADRLNGISYHGSAGFGFTMYRSYSPENGWTEWMKTADPPEKNVLQEGWERLSGNGQSQHADPERNQQAPGMRFEIEHRDGNWIVTSNEKARFINGTRKDEEGVKAARISAEVAATAEAFKKARPSPNMVIPPGVGYGNSDGVTSFLSEMKALQNQFPTDHLAKLEAERDRLVEEKYGSNQFNPVFKGEIFQPRIDFVAKIAAEGASGRSNLRRAASEVEASPETLKEQQEMTIKTFDN